MEPEDQRPLAWAELSEADRAAVFEAYAEREGVSKVGAIIALRRSLGIGVGVAKRLVEEGLASDDWPLYRIRHGVAWRGMPRIWLQ